MKANKSISVTCGIYQTEYKLINKKDGSLEVKVPYVKWDKNNNGTLAFEIVGVNDNRKATVLKMFEDEEMLTPCGRLTLDDILAGY